LKDCLNRFLCNISFLLLCYYVSFNSLILIRPRRKNVRQSLLCSTKRRFLCSQTKILEGGTKDAIRIFEVLFKGVSTQFGPRTIEKVLRNPIRKGWSGLQKSSFGEHKVSTNARPCNTTRSPRQHGVTDAAKTRLWTEEKGQPACCDGSSCSVVKALTRCPATARPRALRLATLLRGAGLERCWWCQPGRDIWESGTRRTPRQHVLLSKQSSCCHHLVTSTDTWSCYLNEVTRCRLTHAPTTRLLPRFYVKTIILSSSCAPQTSRLGYKTRMKTQHHTSAFCMRVLYPRRES